MSWSAISAVAELLGAVGVVVTLLHISRQVRENTRSIRRATTHDALGSIADFDEFVASDTPPVRRSPDASPPSSPGGRTGVIPGAPKASGADG